jgi:uncharacterized protein (TIGR02466 family)
MVGDPASLLQELIARARNLMQQGNWRDAETVLVDGLQRHRDSVDLLRLLGTLHHLAGRHVEAIAYLQRALERAPDDVRAQLNLGAALLSMGRLTEAQDAFSAVLVAQPALEDAHLNLALVLQRRGQMAAAAEHFQIVLQANPAAQDARLSLALTQLSMGAFSQALASAEQLSQDPRSIADAASVQTQALLRLGDVEQAFAVASVAAGAHPEHAVLRAAFGDVLVARGQLGEAINAYEAALGCGDGRLETVLACARCSMESGLYAKAVQLLEAKQGSMAEMARHDSAGVASLWQLLGDALAAGGLHGRALEAYERCMAARPANAQVLCRVAQMQFALGRDSAAQVSLREAGAAEPAASQPCVLAVEQCIAAGQLSQALAHCQRYTSAGYFAHEIVAAETFLLNALGQSLEAQRLAGFEQLVATQSLSPPAAFHSLESFNAALVQGLRAHPSLTAAGALSKATQKGLQSGNLLSARDGVFADFKELLWSAVSSYMAQLPVDQTHPFLGTQVQLTGVHCWGVVLNRAGYQAPHIHPTGWVSGVYYPSLPKSLGADAAYEGWLEFGSSPAALKTGVELERLHVKPEEGLLVLFPSYLYHATVPFSADVERVSLAFDFTYAPA